MNDKEIIPDINYRLRVSNKIRKLEEDVINGVYDNNELIDLVLFYNREVSQLEEELKCVYSNFKK